MTTAHSGSGASRNESIQALIERSSLGDEDGRLARARIPLDVGQHVARVSMDRGRASNRGRSRKG